MLFLFIRRCCLGQFFFLHKQHFGCSDLRFKVYKSLLITDLIKIPKNTTATAFFIKKIIQENQAEVKI